MCESEGLKEKEIGMLSFKFWGHNYGLKVSSFNGMITVTHGGWIVGCFRCKDKMLAWVEEDARWRECAIKGRKLPKATRERIENYLAQDEFAWKGNCE
jgi:hypothetical protein